MVKLPLIEEVGKSGLASFSGQVMESYTNKLLWPDAYGVYDEIRRRDPTIRTMWSALVMLSRTASWYIEAESEDPEDVRTAEFLQECLDDMSQTVEDAFEDALTCVLFGWSWLELVYKRREDGHVGWKKWASRRQSSFYQWKFDETGGLQALVQRPAPDYDEIEIPIEKSMHFIWQRDGSNPEGWALLESLYETWYYVKNLQILSGIGWQRTFVGLPVFKYLETPSADDEAAVKRLGEALVVDAQQYVSVPESVEFSLVSTANSDAGTLLETIKYYRLLMLQSMLADFINLGSGQTGSFALGADKSEMFLMAVDGTLDRMAGIVNRFAIPRLLEYNPTFTGSAKLVHSEVVKPDATALGDWVSKISSLLTWAPEDETWIRKRLGMPEMTEVEEEDEQPPPEEGPAQEPDEGAGEGPEKAGETEELPFRSSGFMEFQESRDERDEIEHSWKAKLLTVLRNQKRSLMDEVAMSPSVPDKAFWDREQEYFRKQALAGLTAVVQGATAAAVAGLEGAVGAGVDWALVNTGAQQWSRAYVGKLITGISGTTRAGVRVAVSNWIEAGGTLPELSKALEPTFGQSRADMIAATEVTRAYDEANDIARQSVGLPATVFKAPAHPRCRCSTHPMLLETGEWVIVWYTANDELVCTQPIKTPWGVIDGCGGLSGMVVGGPKKYQGKPASR